MQPKLTKIWGASDCGAGDTCPGEWSAEYPSGRRTRIRIGVQVTDPEVLAQLPLGPGEIANEVDEADAP